MQRKTVIALLAVLVTLAGVAEAKAEKREFNNVSIEGDELSATGFAVVNYVAGKDKTIVTLQCRDLAPNTTYFVRVSSFSDGSFTTDRHGHGHVTFSVSGDRSNFLVAVHRNQGGNPAAEASLLAYP